MFGLFKKRKVKSSALAELSKLSGAELAEEGLKQISLAISAGSIELQQGQMFEDIYAHADTPEGAPRFSYVMFSPTVQNMVIARCTIILNSNNDGLTSWQMDWAVHKNYRGKRFGSTIAQKALIEFANGMEGMLPNGFIIEAIVDQGNEPSIKIAQSLIGEEEIIIDKSSGKKIHNFLKHFRK